MDYLKNNLNLKFILFKIIPEYIINNENLNIKHFIEFNYKSNYGKII